MQRTTRLRSAQASQASQAAQAAQKLLDIQTADAAQTLLDIQSADAARTLLHNEAADAAQILLEMHRADLYMSRRAERERRSPQDNADETEDEGSYQDQHSGSNDYVQGPYPMHPKKACRARCIDDCNGKRMINAKIKERHSIYAPIDVCEPDCSEAVARCRKGCSFIKQYNAQVAERLETLELQTKILVKRRRIESLMRTQQREGAGDAAVLIRRIERDIERLVKKAKNPAALRLRLARSHAVLQPDEGNESKLDSVPSVVESEVERTQENGDD